jgi:virulence factor Mce-like protein
MIGRRTIINLITFFGLAGLLVVYGFVSLIHNPLARERTIAAVLPDTGGLKPGFSVTMRGVPIGAVSGLKLLSHGVRVTMVLQSGTTVPGDVEARVQRANPLGEQQLDLVPAHNGTAPPLADGATIPVASDPVPPAVGDVVNAANRLFDSVPTQDLSVLIHETAVALAGRSADLRTIVESIDTLSATLVRYQDGFRALLANAPPVLDTVAAVGPQLRQALANTVVLTSILAQRRNDLVQLFDNSAALGSIGTDLLNSQSANLSCLLHDLADVTVNVGAAPNLANLDQTLLLNQYFFGPIDSITPTGPFKSLGPGSPARDNQTWFRVRTILPPAMPAAIAYAPPRSLPPTKPGGACLSVFGPGVGPASQLNPPPPGPGGRLIPAPKPTTPVGGATAGGATAGTAAVASDVAPKPATTSAGATVPGHPELVILLLTILLGWGVADHNRRRHPGRLHPVLPGRAAHLRSRLRRWWP